MDTRGTVEWRKVTCTGVSTPWPTSKHREKMDFPAESFHCPGQTSMTSDTVKRLLHICAKLVKILLQIILTAFKAHQYSGWQYAELFKYFR